MEERYLHNRQLFIKQLIQLKAHVNFKYLHVFSICFMGAFLIVGCGGSRGVPGFGRTFATSSTPSGSGWGWSSTAGLDNANGGMSNWDGLALCTSSTAGFSGTGAGCSQQATIAYTNSRWFVGFPQVVSQTQTAGGTSYFTVNPMVTMSSLTTSLFGALGSGLGFLKSFPSSSDSTATTGARYISFAKLDNGRLLSLYWAYDTSASNSAEVYSNVYDSTSGAWGVAVHLSKDADPGTYASSEILNDATGTVATSYQGDTTRDLSWDGYSGAGYTGQNCRPHISASGNTAMAVWCERQKLTTTPTYTTYARYALYREGVGWTYDTTNTTYVSSPVLAPKHATYTGMNSRSLADFRGQATLASAQGHYRPGMIRRLTIPAFEPNALFAASPLSGQVSLFNPIPRADATFSTNPYTFSVAGAESTNSGGYLLKDATSTTPVSIASDGSHLAEGFSDTNVVRLWHYLPSTGADGGGVGGVNDPFESGNSAIITLPAGGVASGLHLDGTRLYVADSVNAKVYIFGVLPSANCGVSVAPLCTNVVTITMPASATSVFAIGSKLFLSTSTTVYILNGIQSSNCTIAGADCNSTVTLTEPVSPTAIYSDGKRLFVADNTSEKVLIWNRLPTTDASSDFQMTYSNNFVPYGVTADGSRLYVSGSLGGAGHVYIYRKMPFDDVGDSWDTDILFTNPVQHLAWSRYRPRSSTVAGSNLYGTALSNYEWPLLGSTFTPEYSVNPSSADTLNIQFRGLGATSTSTDSGYTGVTFSSLTGDPFYFDRCTAIQNLVTEINNNAALTSKGIKASLPNEWGEPGCNNAGRGDGEFFYLSHNKERSPNDGVDFGNMTTAGTGAEDITVTIAGPTSYGRFFDTAESTFDPNMTATKASTVIRGWQPGAVDGVGAQRVAATSSDINTSRTDAQYFAGFISGDTNTVSTNGLPLLSPNGRASTPISTVAAEQRPVDLSAVGFLDVMGTGAGSFAVVQSSRSFAQPYYKMTCGSLATETVGCNSITTGISQRKLIPSELAFPRVLFGYLYQNNDWLRRYSVGNTAIPQPNFIGPSSPYAITKTDSQIQAMPLGARWPRAVSSSNGNGLLLFYARDGLRPYQEMDTGSFTVSTTPINSKAANRLWMATFDNTAGFSNASVIGPEDSSEWASSSSVNSDLEVCETADPFLGTAGNVTSFTTTAPTNECVVGVDPYVGSAAPYVGSAAPNPLPQDNYDYPYDVPPIPSAMNSLGNGVVGFHRKDADGYVRFHVALYGPDSGLGTFETIDAGTGYTMGGALAIDASGNIAAVWEARSLVYRSSRLNSGTAGTLAENHIYFRYRTASTASWGSIVQLDDYGIDGAAMTNWGTIDTSGASYQDSGGRSFQPRAQMFPNVAISSDGKILTTWSGPACNNLSSLTCRRRQLYREYYNPP